MSDDLRVKIEALVPTPQGVGVFLGDGSGKVIAIFVDPLVATALTMSIRSIKAARPLTHDLLIQILAGLGVRVQKVVINDLKEETFYARLYLLQESELGRNLIEVDARPSDSMVLAVRHGCPIHVARSVWERAEDMRWVLEQARKNSGEPPDESDPDRRVDPPGEGSDE